MSKRLNLAVNVLFVLLAVLAVGWVWGIIFNPDAILSRPARLAYMICDFLIVIPTGLTAGLGLKRGKPWAGPLFALAWGALLFDIAHNAFYLIWDNYFGVPLPVAFLIMVAAAGYAVIVVRALSSE